MGSVAVETSFRPFELRNIGFKRKSAGLHQPAGHEHVQLDRLAQFEDVIDDDAGDDGCKSEKG